MEQDRNKDSHFLLLLIMLVLELQVLVLLLLLLLLLLLEKALSNTMWKLCSGSEPASSTR